MDANQRAEKFVLENELSRATPTIQKAAENIRYTITNICGSYGGTLVKEHEACAAIDVVKEGNVWEQKEYLESFDLVCESHFNYSGAMSKIDSPDSHFHCTDIWWLSQDRGFDIVSLAKAVAMHETADCTKGSAITHNNCFGIRRNGAFVRYETKNDSYKDFMVTWLKYYKVLPDKRASERWSGNDRAEDWLRNVNYFYQSQLNSITQS